MIPHGSARARDFERLELRRRDPGRGYVPAPVARRTDRVAPCLLHALSHAVRVCPVCEVAAAERDAWRDAHGHRLAVEVSGTRLERVLAYLRERGAAAASTIAHHLGMQVYYVLDRLQQDGLIECTHEPCANGRPRRVWRLRGER